MSKGETKDIHCSRVEELGVIKEEGIVVWKLYVELMGGEIEFLRHLTQLSFLCPY